MVVRGKADYREQKLPEYRNNPLIEALPDLFSSQELLQELKKHNFEYNPEEREMEAKESLCWRLCCIYSSRKTPF